VTGQTVVDTGIVCVTTTVVPPSGHSGTSGPQSVMVDTDVVKIVDVLMKVVVTGSVTVIEGVSSGGGTSELGCSGSSSDVAVSMGVSVGSVPGGGGVLSGSSSSGSSVGVGSIGQTVVEMAMVSVTTVVEPPLGQSGTSGPQSVTVRVVVVKMVEVVSVSVGVWH
jgi:hypothetical protein